MKVFLSKAPNVLLESVEMLYAYVNEIPVRELAGEGSYCIPVHIMQKMMAPVGQVGRQSPSPSQ